MVLYYPYGVFEGRYFIFWKKEYYIPIVAEGKDFVFELDVDRFWGRKTKASTEKRNIAIHILREAYDNYNLSISEEEIKFK